MDGFVRLTAAEPSVILYPYKDLLIWNLLIDSM